MLLPCKREKEAGPFFTQLLVICLYRHKVSMHEVCPSKCALVKAITPMPPIISQTNASDLLQTIAYSPPFFCLRPVISRGLSDATLFCLLR